MLRYLIPLGVFAGLVVLLYVGLQHDPSVIPSVLIDKPAPEFEVPQLQDTVSTISKRDMLGKVYLLNVWASWCVTCRQEHPLLNNLSKQGRVNIIGLNYKDERDDALEWLRVLGDPYQVSAFDHEGRVGLDYGVYAVPETFIIDREGIIRHKVIGAITEKELETVILPIIEVLEKAPAS